jgi:hypothetical protein
MMLYLSLLFDRIRASSFRLPSATLRTASNPTTSSWKTASKSSSKLKSGSSSSSSVKFYPESLHQRFSKILNLFGGKSSTSYPSKSTSLSKTPIKVVTDIDDTVVSSGGVKLFGIALGGIDNLYKLGQFYPGAIQFAYELSMAHLPRISGTNSKTHNSSSSFFPYKVSVLTARAKEFKFALALKPNGKLCQAYSKVGNSNLHYHNQERQQSIPLSTSTTTVNHSKTLSTSWGIGTVYYGSVLEWIWQHRKGIRKFKNFQQMLMDDYATHVQQQQQQSLSSPSSSSTPASQALPKYVIIGDTGEKDEEAATRAAQQFGPQRLKAVFLHHVYDIARPHVRHHQNDNHPLSKSRTPSFVSSSSTKSVSTSTTSSTTSSSSSSSSSWVEVKHDVPFHYFRTYIGAAIHAYQSQLLDQAAVIRIARQAFQDLHTLDMNMLSNQPTLHLSLPPQLSQWISKLPRFSDNVKNNKNSKLKMLSSRFLLKQHLKKQQQWEKYRERRWEELIEDSKQCSFLLPLLKDPQLIPSTVVISSEKLTPTNKNKLKSSSSPSLSLVSIRNK